MTHTLFVYANGLRSLVQTTVGGGTPVALQENCTLLPASTSFGFSRLAVSLLAVTNSGGSETEKGGWVCIPVAHYTSTRSLSLAEVSLKMTRIGFNTLITVTYIVLQIRHHTHPSHNIVDHSSIVPAYRSVTLDMVRFVLPYLTLLYAGTNPIVLQLYHALHPREGRLT